MNFTAFEMWLSFLSGAVFAVILTVLLGGIVIGMFKWGDEIDSELPPTYQKKD